jgi:RimJ/RimL family protein N-acetyltransferase
MPDVELRAIERADLDCMKRWRNEIKLYCREYRLLSDMHQEAWWKSYCRQVVEPFPRNLMYGIDADVMPDDPARDRFVGVGGWTNIDWLNRRAELSLYIAPAFQNAGLGRAALNALHSVGFREMGLVSVWLELHDWNPHARHLIENEGYALIGQWRKARLHGGEFFPTWIYDFTDEDYFAKGESECQEH